jgi:putative ABC transport system ATP-binding protein
MDETNHANGAPARQRPGEDHRQAADAGGRRGAVLELRSLARHYGDDANRVHALDGVDLSVRGGELVAVMGPSGSGKSTLLSIAGGLEAPSAGEALLDGTNLWGISDTELAALRRRSIGYVFQELNLLTGLTASENVAAPLELDGVAGRKAAAEARRLLGDVGLGDKLDAFPDDLSGGERQRVAIARALVGRRRLLLADEPTGALDSATGATIMDLLRSATTAGRAVVIVTHDAHLTRWADRVVHLRDGRISGETQLGAAGAMSSAIDGSAFPGSAVQGTAVDRVAGDGLAVDAVDAVGGATAGDAAGAGWDR